MEETGKPVFRRALMAAGVLCGLFFAGFALKEKSFYLLPYFEKPLHPHFETLRSSGKVGLSFGMIGSVLVFLNLGYLFRRQFARAEWLGSLRSWMALHVFTGLTGGGMILFHSAFAPRSALGTVSFWSLAAVVATGLAGRYIYSRVPRSLEGRELEFEEIRKRLASYKSDMETLGLRHEIFQSSLSYCETPADRGLAACLVEMLRGDLEVRREYEALRREVAASERLAPLRTSLLPLAERFCRERQWLKRYSEFRSLMGSWRFLHRWFAVLMLATVAFHVAVALQMGDLWIFKKGQ